jgi:hypothetical protein
MIEGVGTTTAGMQAERRAAGATEGPPGAASTSCRHAREGADSRFSMVAAAAERDRFRTASRTPPPPPEAPDRQAGRR